MGCLFNILKDTHTIKVIRVTESMILYLNHFGHATLKSFQRDDQSIPKHLKNRTLENHGELILKIFESHLKLP